MRSSLESDQSHAIELSKRVPESCLKYTRQLVYHSRGSGEVTGLLTFAIIFSVAIFLMGLLWFLRDSFSADSYERQTVSGYYSDQFTTIDDLPEKSGPREFMVKCQKCGSSYPLGIAGVNQRLSERLGSVTTTCPFCKQQNVTSPRTMTYTVS